MSMHKDAKDQKAKLERLKVILEAQQDSYDDYMKKMGRQLLEVVNPKSFNAISFNAIDILKERAEKNPELQADYEKEKERFDRKYMGYCQGNTKYIYFLMKVVSDDYTGLVEEINNEIEKNEEDDWELVDIKYFNMETEIGECQAFLLFKTEKNNESIS